jgi:N-acetylneuraminic acid mutarotase
MHYPLGHIATILASGFLLLLAATPAQAQQNFAIVLGDARQFFEIKEYEQALKRLEHAKLLAQDEDQRAAALLHEGLVLATLGRRYQSQAAAAFREALVLAPWAKLPTKVSAQVEREFEETRRRVRKDLATGSSAPSAHSARAASDPTKENFGSALQEILQLIDSQEYERALRQFEDAEQRVRHDEQRVTLALYQGVILANLGEQHLERADVVYQEGLALAPWARVPLKVAPQVEREFEKVQVLVLKNLDTLRAALAEDKASCKPTGSMSTPREGHTATLLDSSKVLVTGGIESAGTISAAELYDPEATTWEATDTMSTGRAYHTATKLPSGKVLVAGGESYQQGVLASSELYDPVTGTWSSTGSMIVARYHHRATLLDSGKVLVTGGVDASGERLSSAELYDPATEQWTLVAPMSSERLYHEAVLLKSSGKVLVIGGVGIEGTLSSAELFDPTSQTWTPVVNGLPKGFSEHSATLLLSGKVLVVGGEDGHQKGLARSLLYDPETGNWPETSGSMITGRMGHAAMVLKSGNVLVIGGEQSSSQITANAEVYNPRTRAWTPTARMTTPRRGFTATLLHSGQVLIVGGNSGDAPLSSAELYQP